MTTKVIFINCKNILTFKIKARQSVWKKMKLKRLKHIINVVTEGLEHKIQLMAEGITNVDEKMEHLRQEVKEDFKETRTTLE